MLKTEVINTMKFSIIISIIGFNALYEAEIKQYLFS